MSHESVLMLVQRILSEDDERDEEAVYKRAKELEKEGEIKCDIGCEIDVK